MQIILIFTLTSLVLGVIIVIIDSVFNNETSNTDEIEKLLPGINCGICGYNTCSSMAEVLLKDPNEYVKCRPLKDKSELIAYLKLKKIL